VYCSAMLLLAAGIGVCFGAVHVAHIWLYGPPCLMPAALHTSMHLDIHLCSLTGYCSLITFSLCQPNFKPLQYIVKPLLSLLTLAWAC
jgi:hypothetical protein